MNFEEVKMPVRVYLPTAALEKCSRIQKHTGLSLSKVVERAVHDYLTKREADAKDNNNE